MISVALLSFWVLCKAESFDIPSGYLFSIVISASIFGFAALLRKGGESWLSQIGCMLAIISALVIATAGLDRDDLSFGATMIIALLPWSLMVVGLLGVFISRIATGPPGDGGGSRPYY